MHASTLQQREPSHLAKLPVGGDPTIDRLSKAMCRAYLAAGGLASGDEVAGMLREQSDQPVSLLARWIVSRQVVSFVWRSQTFLPLCQFDLSSMSLRPCVRQVMAELLLTFDDWELARWFTLPNARLGGAAPLEGISSDPHSVVQAARADRFIAMG